jgi:hypothetical protein
MTVMEVPGNPPECFAIEKQRLQLNDTIKTYVAEKKWERKPEQERQEQGGQGQQQHGGSGSRELEEHRVEVTPKVVVFDLASALSFEAMGKDKERELCDDGLHLTVKGYNHMGQLIAEALRPILTQDTLPAEETTVAKSFGD